MRCLFFSVCLTLGNTVFREASQQHHCSTRVFFLTVDFNRVNQSDHNTIIFTFDMFCREVGDGELAFMASP